MEECYDLVLVPLLMLFFFLEQVLCVMPRVLMSTRYELNENMLGTIPGTEFLAKDENSNLIGYAALMG